MALRVYLDSADYSVLSDPRRQTPQTLAIRDKLLEWAESGEVEFRYSGTHISEMAPLPDARTTDAEARADLLVALCGKKTLLAFDRLILLELEMLAKGQFDRELMYSDSGDWFPDFGEVFPMFSWDESIKHIDKIAKEDGWNRSMRRKIKKKTFKNSKPTKSAEEMFAESRVKTVDEILRKYPMRPDDAEVLISYQVGSAPPKAAEEAFLASLRDPRWMMRWFDASRDQLNPIIDWFRHPAKDICARIKEMAELALELRSNLAPYAPDVTPEELIGSAARDRIKNGLLQSVPASFAERLNVPIGEVSTKAVLTYARGLSACIGVAVQSAWNSVGATPRAPLESDFVDAVHCTYAEVSCQ